MILSNINCRHKPLFCFFLLHLIHVFDSKTCPQDAVVSFPLYAEALKFAHYGEKMIQIAVRAITLNVYNGILVP